MYFPFLVLPYHLLLELWNTPESVLTHTIPGCGGGLALAVVVGSVFLVVLAAPGAVCTGAAAAAGSWPAPSWWCQQACSSPPGCLQASCWQTCPPLIQPWFPLLLSSTSSSSIVRRWRSDRQLPLSWCRLLPSSTCSWTWNRWRQADQWLRRWWCLSLLSSTCWWT